jgi:hypothetical protein
VTFVPGNPSKDSTLPLPWPYALLDGWSVEWDPSPANIDHTELTVGAMLWTQSSIVSLVGDASHAFAGRPAGRIHGPGRPG